MNVYQDMPSFDLKFKELSQFILTLVEDYSIKRINSWGDLDKRVKSFFTHERMDEIEKLVPGWKKMASFSDGITLTHVTCVFFGLCMLPEYQKLSSKKQQLAKWIVLFHDIDKFHIRGKKDTMHAFRSGAVAANILPKIGFHPSEKYKELIQSWSEFTINAFTIENEDTSPKPDNRKLPKILSGVEQLFGKNTPPTLIIKTVLLHISLNVDIFYPTPSPLTDDETKCFLGPALFPLLKVMMLADNEGWALFDAKDRARQRHDTLKVFDRVESLIS